MKGYCDNCGKVIDETEIYRFEKKALCHHCYIELKYLKKKANPELEKTWYDNIARKGKCDACKQIKTLQWDTIEGHFCHDCLCNSQDAFKVFLNHFEVYGDNDSGAEYELFTSKEAMLKKKGEGL